MTTDDQIADAAITAGFIDAAADDIELFPAPSQPMKVARQLQPDWLHDRHPTLRNWRRTWMRWQRTHWAEIDDAEIRSRLYRRLEHAEYEVLNQVKGTADRRSWAPTKKKIADLLDALSAITLLPSTVDAPSWADRRDEGVIVACANGLLRVADRKLLDHDPRLFNLVSVPFAYDPAAPAPARWLSFLRETWTDDGGDVDQAAIDALQEFFGYVVSGRTDLHKILLIVGPTRSGKGTIGRILGALVGKGNVAGPTLASLATNFGLGPLLGKPVAVISDARLGGANTHQVVERLLTISGEDTIDVDRKFRDPWTGRLPTRFLILSNELPSFGDASGAIAHRFIVLLMQHSWLGQENPALTEELLAELPGILNWALDGLARLTERGRFTEPDSSTDAVVAMKDSASPMSAFVRECCDVGAGREVLVDELWKAWRAWCEDNGRDRAGTKQMFGKNLQSVVPRSRRARPRGDDGRQVPTYLGITLKGESHNALGRDSARLNGSDSGVSRAESRPTPLRLSHSTEDPYCAECGMSGDGKHTGSCPAGKVATPVTDPSPKRVRVTKRDGAVVVPDGAIYIGRPSRGMPKTGHTEFGNPHRVGRPMQPEKPCRDPGCAGAIHDRDEAIAAYRVHLRQRPDLVAAVRSMLAGRDVACWCPTDLACHGDVLLAVAAGGQP